MAPPSAAPSPAARRLQRLRRRMTLYFALASAVALLILTTVAVVVSGQLRAAGLQEEMAHRLDVAQNIIGYDRNNHLDLTAFTDDPISSGSPQVYVFERPDPKARNLVRVFAPRHADLEFAGALETTADEAITRNDAISTSVVATDGTLAQITATSVLDDNEDVRAAIVVVGDPTSNDNDTLNLTFALLAVTFVLVLASAFIGYLLAGRSMRPAVQALEQQERFLADAAHELRTPVARLRTAAEGGLVAKDPEATRAALQSMSVLAEQAGEVVDNLLMLARMEAGAVSVQAERLRLDQLVGDVVADHPGVVFEGASSVVTADPALIRRAVDNLVTNAVRHARGAEVVVQVHGPTVVVLDRGPGIDVEVLPRLFDRFVTNPVTGGSGLGLSIVREIAEAHGGTVTGRNRADGTGAEFWLSLPG